MIEYNDSKVTHDIIRKLDSDLTPVYNKNVKVEMPCSVANSKQLSDKIKQIVSEGSDGTDYNGMVAALCDNNVEKRKTNRYPVKRFSSKQRSCQVIMEAKPSDVTVDFSEQSQPKLLNHITSTSFGDSSKFPVAAPPVKIDINFDKT